MFVEFYIEGINDMLFSAYVHGGEPYAPYGSESDFMKKTIEDFLTEYGIKDKYEYGECDREYNNYCYKQVPQIVRKKSFKELKNKYTWE